MTSTTIEVSLELRDRIAREARERGVSAGHLIEGLLDANDRRRRMEAFGRAFRGTDESYRDEFAAWDVTLTDDAEH